MLNKISILVMPISPIFERVYNIYINRINEAGGIYAMKTKRVTLFEVGGHNYYEGAAKIAKLSEQEDNTVIVLSGLSETQEYFKDKEYLDVFKKENVKKFLLPILGYDKLKQIIEEKIN